MIGRTTTRRFWSWDPTTARPVPENFWCLNDAFQGVQVFGGTGSGKSSGSGQALARAFLEANMGGLVLTAKTDEVSAWQEYAKAAGRETDLLIVDEKRQAAFQFLQLRIEPLGSRCRAHRKSRSISSRSVLEASERKHGQGGWQRRLLAANLEAVAPQRDRSWP